MVSTMRIILAAAVFVGQPLSAPPEARGLTLARGRAFVPVWLNGVGPYPFLIDTAAPYVALDAPIAATLALPETGEPEQLGDFSAQPVRIQALEVAGRPAIACNAYAADLSPMEAAYGLRVAGILGLPGLPDRFLFNCEQQTIGRFPPETGPEWFAVPMKTADDGVLRVTVTIDKEYTVDAAVDTAFSGTLAIPQALLKQWGLFSESTPRLRTANGGAVQGATQIRLTQCAVGDITVNGPLCSLSEEPGARLGMRFLSRFEVALDREVKMLYLRPLVPVPWSDPPVCSAGLAPAECVDGLWSFFVAEDSPAQMAEILPEDLLVSVNGLDMAGQSFDYVQRALTGKPGAFLDVAVQRGDEVLVFRVAVEEAL